ncbi:MAG: phosphatase PAP2 family protein [Bacteroidetes bacterium]|nr:phosphatase PAP2 family protein [Bacteroidota bacterium]
MDWHRRLLLCILLPIAAVYTACGQSTYALKKRYDPGFCAANLLWSGANLYASRHYNQKVNMGFGVAGPDKWAPQTLRKGVARAADVTLIATGAAAALWWGMGNANNRRTFGVITAENVWLTWNCTQTIKMLVNRPRPYARSMTSPYPKKDDAWSFVSGHSSVAGATLASVWLLGPSSGHMSAQRQKILVGTTGILALGTAVLRVCAGKHYPSDVLAGFALGMGVAWLNTKLHAK